MSIDSKFQKLEKKETSGSTLSNDVDFATVFNDHLVSTFSKAVLISPYVSKVTLGERSEKLLKEEQENYNGNTDHNSESVLISSDFRNITKNHSRFDESIENSMNLKNNLAPYFEEKRNSNNFFPYHVLVNEFDVQRRLTVDKVMRERIQNMYDERKLIRDSLEHLKQTKQEEAIAKRFLQERKILDDIHELEILNKPKRDAQRAKDNLKEALRIQERDQKVKEAEEEARKKAEFILTKRENDNLILTDLEIEYNKEYANMLETFKLCKDKVALKRFFNLQSAALNHCNDTFKNLLKQCECGDISKENMEMFKELIMPIKSIHKWFSEEITKSNETVKTEVKTKENIPKNENETESKIENENENETKTKIENETKTKIENENTFTQKSNESSTPQNSDLSDCFDSKTLEQYLNLKNYLQNYEKTIAPLLSDDSLKKFRFNCQKAVTIPVNAISPISSSHLSDKYIKLHNLLSGKVVEIGDIKISASHHPLGVAYCKYLLAKKFVRQGDLTVSSKPDAAFSIATVLASLWIDFPDFGQLVLAYFQSACPYLAPIFMPQVEGQSDEDYHKSLGYHYSQNGEVEKQDSFLKRMSGIMRLYSALLISNVRQPGKMNPLGLSEGWRWISALLNLEPRPDICATLLYDFLEVAGNEMFRAYGGQFKKMLAYICQEYFPKLEKVTPSSAGGPIVRLEEFLQKTLKKESIPSPQGILPPNFW